MPGKRSRPSAGGMPTSPPPRSGEVDGGLSFRGELVGLAHAATLQEPNGERKPVQTDGCGQSVAFAAANPENKPSKQTPRNVATRTDTIVWRLPPLKDNGPRHEKRRMIGDGISTESCVKRMGR